MFEEGSESVWGGGGEIRCSVRLLLVMVEMSS